MRLVFLNDSTDSLRLDAAEPAASRKPDGVKPEFSRRRFPFHVNVRRLITVSGIEKEPIRTNSKNRRHRLWCGPLSLMLPLLRKRP